jgi:RimJ/RimL family protein N-acetyltransferase
MSAEDVPAVLAVQEPGAVRGLADVFPQNFYPFPRDDVARRWETELATAGIDCFVIEHDGAVLGFASIRGDEFFHFGIAVELWGSGLAQRAHDEVLERMRARGVRRAWLRVFTKNGRGRRFYEKLGWRPTGECTNSTFPPYGELLHYELELN